MLWKKLRRSIREMPRAAYIFLRAALAESCALLFIAWLLFLRLERSPADHGLRMTALAFLETPAGVLLLGLIGMAILMDYASKER